MELIITALFGLESLVRDDLEAIGYDRRDIEVQDGLVILRTPQDQLPAAIARTNIWVRRGERVLLCVGRFKATTFDEFFDGTRNIAWEDLIPESFAFHVNGFSRKSILFGIPSCQRLCKKAIVRRLLEAKGKSEGDRLVEDESTGVLKIQFGIVSDEVCMMIDTSGDGLHKRGYRPLLNVAPIKETLASGMVSLSQYHPFEHEALVDPFCGSGTIVIEAAMFALNVAPGLFRAFSAEKWPFVGKKVFDDAREEARSLRIERPKSDVFFFGSDIDTKVIETATRNAHAAGVGDYVRFAVCDAFSQTPEALKQWTGIDRQLVLTNPPYGGRLMTPEDAFDLFRRIAATYLDEKGFCRKGIRLSVISPDDTFEKAAIRPADKRRKLYNGSIRCQMNHYFRMAREIPNDD